MSWNRGLTAEEKALARSVFHDTLPLDRVFVTPYSGHGGRPFTVSVPPLSPSWFSPYYLINLGPTLFGVSAGNPATLIHELTHVWQGQHSPWNFMISSIAEQAISAFGGSAYAVQPGLPWWKYGVEQQAMLVEEWFRAGMRPDDPRYQYMVNNIWRA